MTIGRQWVLGIDEAGYGPNLGPLVQVAAAVLLPLDDPTGWETFRPHVRRAGGRWGRDSRLVIDDSKRVHHGPNALAKLEAGVLPAIPDVRNFGELLHRISAPAVNADLRGEAWFDPNRNLPVEADSSEILTRRESLATFAGARFGPIFARLVPTPSFNARVRSAGSKAAILTDGLIELLRLGYDATAGDEPLRILCDKQGGRAFYAAPLQEAFPDGFVLSEVERPTESRYRIVGLDREVTVSFRPRADSDCVAVALASMVAKYLREVCMLQFNAFWTARVPGIVPTAGYPEDAKRFFAEIQPALTTLNWPIDAIWRCK